MGMRARIGRFTAALVLLLSAVSCFKDSRFTPGTDGGNSEGRVVPTRQDALPNRQVMMMVSAGYNSLSGYLKTDLNDLSSNYLPQGTDPDTHVLVVLAHLPTGGDLYTTPAPVLYRMYAQPDGAVVRDTLKCWGEEDGLCDPAVFQEALELVYRRFPARGYGMVFSSHATGWMPEGYYRDPSKVDPQYSANGRLAAPAHHFPPLLRQEGEPEVKTLGEDELTERTLEMELEDFAASIPMHLDYLLIDACLSGCVEVAHALRGKADFVGFSPTEVLASGFDYSTITGHLLRDVPDPEAVCRDYFAYYDKQTDMYRSATICLVDTRRMDALETVCRELFGQYREALAQLKGSAVQGYFRYNRHFFYDLKDVLVKAGITEAEEARLDAALDQCVVYKAATPWFMYGGSYGFPISQYCGMSMYLPSMGTDMLDTYYKQHVSWNQATGLVP